MIFLVLNNQIPPNFPTTRSTTVMAQSFSFLLRILILNLLITAPALAGENPWDTKLPFKKATLNYSITGTENGSETLYIRNYGKEQATYRNTTSKIFFMTTKTESIQIVTPDWIYSIDLQEKTGSKSVNPTKYMIEEYNSLSRSDRKKVLKNSEELGHSVTEGLQGEIEKNAAKILGYSCDKVSVMGSTIYMISGTGLPLKSETSMAGMNFKSVATGIDKGSAPDNVFIPPAGINLAMMAVDMNVHVYDDNPSKRFVLIDMKRYAEGHALPQGPIIERITPDGIVLSYKGQRFQLTRN